MNSKDKQVKQTQIWDAWTATLTDEAKKALQSEIPNSLPTSSKQQHHDEEEIDAYQFFRLSLTTEARTALDSLVNTEPTIEEDVDSSIARFCLVEAADGEWATIRMFKTVEGLARRLCQLEGSDIVGWPFFGIPLQFTKGPQRYLLLPDGKSAIQIPMYDGGPCKIVPADLLVNMDVQEDGFLGKPELANTRMPKEKDKITSKDDEEGEEETVGVD